MLQDDKTEMLEYFEFNIACISTIPTFPNVIIE